MTEEEQLDILQKELDGFVATQRLYDTLKRQGKGPPLFQVNRLADCIADHAEKIRTLRDSIEARSEDQSTPTATPD